MNARNKPSPGSKADADLDPTFGDQGITVLPTPADYSSTDVFGIATAPDDSIFAAVTCEPSSRAAGLASPSYVPMGRLTRTSATAVSRSIRKWPPSVPN